MIELPRVTHILEAEGLIDFSSVPSRVLDASQKFGSAVHKACTLWDKKILNVKTLSKPLIPYLEAWKSFREAWEIKKFNLIEKRLNSTKWGFTGEPDRVFTSKGRRILIDIKSSTEIPKATGLQLAAYEILYTENFRVKIHDRWAVQLKGNGKFKIERFTYPADKVTFLAALQVFKWKQQYFKKGKGICQD
jgi:hypothetical protein